MLGRGVIDVAIHAVLVRGGFVDGEADEFTMGTEPGALVGCDLALDPSEEFGGGRLGEHDIDEGGAGGFGEQLAEQVGFETLEAAFVPVGADQAVDEEAVHDGVEGVGCVVGVGECLVGVRVLAGEGDGGGIDAVFQGVEAGDGLALGGAWSCGMLRVRAIRA